MKTIVINPQNHTIMEAEYNGDWKQINSLLSYPDQKIDCFDIVRIDDSETIFVDDNGLINSNGARHGFFYVKGEYPVMLAGKGVILATDEDGESIGTSLTVEQVKDMVLFGAPEIDYISERVSFMDTNGVIHPLDW